MTSSKLKIGVLGAVVAALVGCLVMQRQRLAALENENQTLRGLEEQLTQLQAQNEQLSDRLARLGGSSFSEIQLRDLARLRSEVDKLRAQTNADADVLAENNLMRSQVGDDVVEIIKGQAAEEASRDQCISNLTLINAAKAQWAADNNKPPETWATIDDLAPYLPDGFPVCPDRGAYFVGTAGGKAWCSVPGHRIAVAAPAAPSASR
jgi:hypothetical protein